MRVVIDEDIPKELTPLFARPGLLVDHVEDIGLKGTKNGVLLAALSANCDILVTGDTNVGHQPNLGKFDLAIVLIHPRRLVVELITPLIQAEAWAVLDGRLSEALQIGPAVVIGPTSSSAPRLALKIAETVGLSRLPGGALAELGNPGVGIAANVLVGRVSVREEPLGPGRLHELLDHSAHRLAALLRQAAQRRLRPLADPQHRHAPTPHGC
ncbi:MAG: DUF5615 family PIN-like protein [Chloroflexi bacterium]|nr:DUF5615 family PIN-like protein [Chloroflexota bacterium]